MAYLSRLYLNPLRRRTQEFLRNPEKLHAAILNGIPTQPVTERTLWRLEPNPTHRAELLVLTQTRPSWEALIEQAGWPNAEHPQARTADLTPLLDTLHLGRAFRMRIRVNPVTAVKAPPPTRPEATPTRGRPIPVKGNQQPAWLLDHLPRWGFQPLTNSIGEPELVQLERTIMQFPRKSSNTRVTLSAATFEARVTISDPGTATRSILNGVGRARAYGFGLITLAPDTAG